MLSGFKTFSGFYYKSIHVLFLSLYKFLIIVFTSVCARPHAASDVIINTSVSHFLLNMNAFGISNQFSVRVGKSICFFCKWNPSGGARFYMKFASILFSESLFHWASFPKAAELPQDWPLMTPWHEHVQSDWGWEMSRQIWEQWQRSCLLNPLLTDTVTKNICHFIWWILICSLLVGVAERLLQINSSVSGCISF